MSVTTLCVPNAALHQLSCPVGAALRVRCVSVGGWQDGEVRGLAQHGTHMR